MNLDTDINRFLESDEEAKDLVSGMAGDLFGAVPATKRLVLQHGFAKFDGSGWHGKSYALRKRVGRGAVWLKLFDTENDEFKWQFYVGYKKRKEYWSYKSAGLTVDVTTENIPVIKAVLDYMDDTGKDSIEVVVMKLKGMMAEATD